MNRLLEIGFQLAGHWLLEGSALKLELVRFATRRNVLYAFVSDGDVKYVGKTVTPLVTRMRGYLYPSSSQTTNVRGNAAIKELLRAGAAVELFVLPDNGLLRYGGFHINLAAGLEDDLIRSIGPEWNGGHREVVLEEAAEGPGKCEPSVPLGHDGEEVPDPLEVKGSFTIVLHATYYRQGFFNVDVDHQELLGADGDQIEIYLGSSGDPVTGSINRSANTNHTPRIMGGRQVRDWFQASGKEKDRLSVTVLSPRSIRLEVVPSGVDDG